MTNSVSRKQTPTTVETTVDVKEYTRNKLEIYPIENSSLWGIRMDKGGRIPNALTGVYTSEKYALTAIERFLATNA